MSATVHAPDAHILSRPRGRCRAERRRHRANVALAVLAALGAAAAMARIVVSGF